MKTKLSLLLGLAALLTSCGYNDSYDELEYLTGPDESCTDKCTQSQFCINAVCMPKMDGGEECYGDHQCISNICQGVDRDNGAYFGKCMSYGGSACKNNSDCVSGTCNNGVCACSDHKGCSDNAVCDAGTCLPIVECPSDSSASCVLIHDVVPNISWANDSAVTETADDPYFGNMISFKLPPKYAYSCGVMMLYIIGGYLGLVGESGETALNIVNELFTSGASDSGSKDMETIFAQFASVLSRMTASEKILNSADARMLPSCFSMELPTGNTNDDTNKIAYLEYSFTPNNNIKSIASVESMTNEYKLYFTGTLMDSALMGSELFQMTLGTCEDYFKNNQGIEDKTQCIKMSPGSPSVNFPLNGTKTISSKMAYDNSGIYRVYFMGTTGAKVNVDNVLSFYCDSNYNYVYSEPDKDDNGANKVDENGNIIYKPIPPKVGNDPVGCKTVNFMMPSLKVYVEIDKTKVATAKGQAVSVSDNAGSGAEVPAAN